MDTGSKRTQRDYASAFKLAVVEQVEKGELNQRTQLRILPPLPSHSRP